MSKLKHWLQKWLDIKEPVIPTFNRELQMDFDRLKNDLEFWKREFKKRTPTGKCTECDGTIDLWPFNDKLGYYIEGDKVKHQKCPNKGDD